MNNNFVQFGTIKFLLDDCKEDDITTWPLTWNAVDLTISTSFWLKKPIIKFGKPTRHLRGINIKIPTINSVSYFFEVGYNILNLHASTQIKKNFE